MGPSFSSGLGGFLRRGNRIGACGLCSLWKVYPRFGAIVGDLVTMALRWVGLWHDAWFLWYHSDQCDDGEGCARRVRLQRGKVTGWKPSYKNKGTAFTPEQQPERRTPTACADAPKAVPVPSREAASPGDIGSKEGLLERKPAGQSRWYRGIQPSLGNKRARGRFSIIGIRLRPGPVEKSTSCASIANAVRPYPPTAQTKGTA